MSERLSLSNKSTPTKLSNKDYKSLEQIVNFPEKNMSTIGIILDATGNYKTDDSYDYVNKIKIIDITHNPKKCENKNIEPYVMIFVFTSKLKETPVIRKIGDIILLRNFYFDNYQNMVKGVYKKSKSEWQLFDSRANSSVAAFAGSKQFPSQLTQQEQDKIIELKNWSRHFFTNNSILNLAWYKCDMPEQREEENIYSMKDVDLVVKVVGCYKCFVDDSFYTKIVFADEKKVLYFTELKDIGSDIEIDSVVKLRSVQIYFCNGLSRIDFFNYSDILKLQDYFKDARNILTATKDLKYDSELLEHQFLEELHLEKYQKKELGKNVFVFYEPNKTNRNQLLQKFQAQFPILKNFEINRRVVFKELSNSDSFSKDVGSLIMKKHEDLPLSDIESLCDLYHKVNKKGGHTLFLEKKMTPFRIRAKLNDMKFTNLDSIAKIYSPSKKKLWILKDKSKADADDKRIIFYNIFNFSDENQKKNETLPVYLASFDGNPQFIFDLWRILPDVKDVDHYYNMSENLKKEFEKNMKSLQEGDKEFDIVVQLAKNEKDKYYYRLIDTIFWFQN